MTRSKRPPKQRFIYGVKVVLPGCFIGLAEDVVGILTLGYYVPPWRLDWYFYAIKKMA